MPHAVDHDPDNDKHRQSFPSEVVENLSQDKSYEEEDVHSLTRALIAVILALGRMLGD